MVIILVNMTQFFANTRMNTMYGVCVCPCYLQSKTPKLNILKDFKLYLHSIKKIDSIFSFKVKKIKDMFEILLKENICLHAMKHGCIVDTEGQIKF